MSWKPETPGRVPAGARISAGKSGKVARSFPKTAAVLVNWLPVICMPSPESPQKRMTAPLQGFLLAALDGGFGSSHKGLIDLAFRRQEPLWPRRRAGNLKL